MISMVSKLGKLTVIDSKNINFKRIKPIIITREFQTSYLSKKKLFKTNNWLNYNKYDRKFESTATGISLKDLNVYPTEKSIEYFKKTLSKYPATERITRFNIPDLAPSRIQKWIIPKLLKTFNIDPGKAEAPHVACFVYYGACHIQGEFHDYAYFSGLTKNSDKIGQQSVTNGSSDISKTGITNKENNIANNYPEEDLSREAYYYYNVLKLNKSLNQWCQITYLYMWMIYARMRNLEKSQAEKFKSLFVEAHFTTLEKILYKEFKIKSNTRSTKVLKDLAAQMRGAFFAYDEGLVLGDSVMATSLWRNFYAQRDDVSLNDIEHLVRFVNTQLYVLDNVNDQDFMAGMAPILKPYFDYVIR